MFALNKEQLQHVAEKWFDSLQADVPEDAKLVQKGLLLFQQQQVYQLKLENERLVGTVQDVTPVKVKVDLSFLEMSACTCPANYYCRHQLAAFFTAYNEIGSVENLIEKWRAPMRLKKVAEQFGLKKASQFMKESTSSMPNYDHWLATFSNSFHSIVVKGMKRNNPYIVDQLFSIYMRRIKAGTPAQQEWKQLYLLIASVYSFKRLISFSHEFGFSEKIMKRHFYSLFLNLLDNAEQYIHRLNVHSVPFSFDSFMEKLRSDTAELLTVGVHRNRSLLTHEIISFYSLLWDGLFKKTGWRTAELARLEKLIHECEHDEQLFIYSTSYLQLLFLSRQDDNVLSRLPDADLQIIPYVLTWMKKIRKQTDWRRMAPYLEFLMDKSQEYVMQLQADGAREQYVRQFIKEVHRYCAVQKRFDLYEKSILQMLPYSFQYCNDFYFHEEQYVKWVELMIFQKFFVNEIDPYQLKTVEKVNPELLLPIYHQSVQHHIELRSRENYRQAVKQLRKLRSVYRKLKSEEKWETFFHLLLKSTRRLRAFHEECRIGNLMD